METVAFESDQLLKLLTDALRRGPGTPEWHEAIELLKRDGLAGADEYRLLMTVRERLESGQHYREVRAGPNFTRELFDRIESGEGAAGSRRPATTLVVALVCLVALVGSIGLLVAYLSQISSVHNGGADRLASQLFITPIKAWSFVGPLPADLKRAGSLKLEPFGGLRPSRDNEKRDSVLVYSESPIDLTNGGICVEMQVRYQPGPTSLQMLLISADGAVEEAAALGIECTSTGVRVTGSGATGETRPLPSGVYTLRMKMVDNLALAELNGQQIWSGTHPFAGQARVGVRISKTGRPQGGVAVQSLRILAP